jgi:hypothetical protein
MTVVDWDFSIEDTAAKLVEVSEKARERARLKGDGYALITARSPPQPSKETTGSGAGGNRLLAVPYATIF